jgi:hypothetical protein
MAKGIDRAVPFKREDELKKLLGYGYTFICRYLTPSAVSWKALTKDEAFLISRMGLWVVSVYQGSANRADYFTYAQGKLDGLRAIDAAKRVGMPENGVIYFAVDYDARKVIPAVAEYFKGVVEGLAKTKYRIGVYGCYDVCVKVPELVKRVEFKWQTLAWSNGKKCDYNLYQHKIDTFIPEDKKMVGFDLNLSNGNGGGWKLR